MLNVHVHVHVNVILQVLLEDVSVLIVEAYIPSRDIRTLFVHILHVHVHGEIISSNTLYFICYLYMCTCTIYM